MIKYDNELPVCTGIIKSIINIKTPCNTGTSLFFTLSNPSNTPDPEQGIHAKTVLGAERE